MPRMLSSPEDRRAKLLQSGTGLALIAGWVVLLLSLLIWGGSGAYLPRPAGIDFLAEDSDHSALGGWVNAVAVMVAAVLCAGLPSERHEPRVLWGAFGQVFGGVIGAVVTYYALLLSAVDEGTRLWVAYAPTAVLGVSMVVLGLLYQWVPWRVRAFGPALAWGVLTLLVTLFW
ncbi:hypothetical protein LWF15_28895 [Kineosporia rhizophila]|uniref:hypothetical protein n=1 Tax=Kineosporia rhizophila TaxID=84633 RepID=UPI001E382FC1|nr:hypothetical protein [Kineosporia rhizophila]MCE0539524.1 hypothetical protein [Kineosporia rhizophila]